MIERQSRIRQVRDHPQFDVVIVGGGINGIGVFRDLALQGVDVLLVDKDDYCSGASAASSHMAHGGIRYLENGEFRLVREAVQERNRLIENAPHLVTPLPTTIPIFSRFSGMLNAPLKFLRIQDESSERGEIIIRLGMSLYDAFARSQDTVPRHVVMNRDSSLAAFPALNPDIRCTGTYYDGAIFCPERLAVELLLDGAKANNRAVPLNYVEANGIRDQKVVLTDTISGKELVVSPKVVVNAGGPWIDSINTAFGRATHYIEGTKGSHLVLNHPELRRAIGEHEFYFENRDGRMVLAFPLGSCVLVGTSDIRVETPEGGAVSDEEIDYFIDLLRRIFPQIRVSRDQIVFTFSGVRPLASSSSTRTGQISRDHKIEELTLEGEPAIPVFSLVGGKWTSFRAFGELACDRILACLDTHRRASTRDLPIGGGGAFPKSEGERVVWVDEVSARSGLPAERVEALLERYGSRGEAVADHVSAGPDKELTNYPSYSQREVEFIVEEEDVVHLDDFIFRRSMIGMLGKCTSQGIHELGEVVGEVKGWDADRLRIETDRAIRILRVKHRMDFGHLIEK